MSLWPSRSAVTATMSCDSNICLHAMRRLSSRDFFCTQSGFVVFARSAYNAPDIHAEESDTRDKEPTLCCPSDRKSLS